MDSKKLGMLKPDFAPTFDGKEDSLLFGNTAQELQERMPVEGILMMFGDVTGAMNILKTKRRG